MVTINIGEHSGVSMLNAPATIFPDFAGGYFFLEGNASTAVLIANNGGTPNFDAAVILTGTFLYGAGPTLLFAGSSVTGIEVFNTADPTNNSRVSVSGFNLSLESVFNNVLIPRQLAPLYAGQSVDVLGSVLFGDILAGGDLDDELGGFGGNDTLHGNGGNDLLIGGEGADAMHGGAGNDDYEVDNVSDTIVEAANGGDDFVSTTVSYTLAANVESLVLSGLAANGTGNAGANGLFGNAFANVLSGMGGDDVLVGNGGNDTLNGGDGNDILNGGSGNDSMAGGLGHDTYFRDSLSDVITEAASAGTDAVVSTLAYTLGVNVENLTLAGVSSINGTGNTLNNVLVGNSGNNVLNGSTGTDTASYAAATATVKVNLAIATAQNTLGAGTDTLISIESLIGGSGNDTLTGNSGNNVLNGNGGNDTMVGGLGNDTYVRNATGDVVTEAAGAGTDTVQSYVTYALPVNVENLTLLGTAAINATGNTLNNVLTGNSANNVLNGSTGNDTMAGGLGNDTYIRDAAGDVVTEAANAGTDTVQSYVTYTLPVNVENLTLLGTVAINATGNTLNNVLTGNAGNNVLNGSTGTDTASYAAATATVKVNLAIAAAQNTLGAGTDTLISIESLIGGSGNDTLTGNSAANVLNGNGGNDTMVGGLGNDTYVRNATGDVVTEAVNAGTDTVQSYVTYTLPVNVENLTLLGTAAINATGNTLANVLTGNSANNVLNGSTGNDTMAGGLGNDTYIRDAAGDVVTEAANAGTDTVQSAVSYTLGANLENLTLLGATAINGTGNTLSNTIIGNGAANVLSGGLGNDLLDGGAGNDTLMFAAEFTYLNSDLTFHGGSPGVSGIDTSVSLGGRTSSMDDYRGGSGTDTLQGTAGADAIILHTNASHRILTDIEIIKAGAGNDIVDLTSPTYAYSNVTIFGEDGDDVLWSGQGNDTLDGGAGADDLIGWLGADTLNGGAGSDLLYWDAADVAINGGLDFDFLVLLGVGANPQFNLATIAGNSEDLESVVFAGEAGTLALSLQDVLDMSSTTEVLRIEGGAQDTVNSDGGWAYQSGQDQVIGSSTFRTYFKDAATLLIDQTITFNNLV